MITGGIQRFFRPSRSSEAEIAMRGSLAGSTEFAHASKDSILENGTLPVPEKSDVSSREMPGLCSPVPVRAARGRGLAVADCGNDCFNVVGHSDFWQQYDGLYAARLRQLRGVVDEEARALWSPVVKLHCFLGAISGHVQACKTCVSVVVVGILFRCLHSRCDAIAVTRKSMMASTGHAGGVLDDLETAESSLASQADQFFLEDETMRVELEFSQTVVAALCTGLVVAVNGRATADGKFAVQALCFPRALAPPSTLPPFRESSRQPATFIAFVSGLHFGDACATAAHICLAEWLSGKRHVAVVCDGTAAVPSGSAVLCVVVCGGLLAPALASAPENHALQAMKDADSFLAQLCASVPVKLMPGRGDPTGACLPQAPLLPHLFGKLRVCCDFQSVGNPYKATFGSLRLLGHAGQPVDDILRCSSVCDPLAALALALDAHHLAPTAPDTLAARSLPLDGKDPFVLGAADFETPHVLFSGGHGQAGHLWHVRTGVQCIVVPCFRAMPAVVLVNLCAPRDVRVVSFLAGKELDAGAVAGV